MRTAQIQQQQQQQITTEQVRAEADMYKETITAYKDVDKDMETFFSDLDEDIAAGKAKRVQWRIDNCGSHQYFADLQNGKRRYRIINCNICEKCKKQQASYMAGRVNNAIEQHNSVRMMRCGEEEMDIIWEKVEGKKNVYKIPQENDEYVLIVPAYLTKKGKKLQSHNMTEIVSNDEWLEIVNNVPRGRRTSGSLGKVEDTDQNNKVVVQIDSVTFEDRDIGNVSKYTEAYYKKMVWEGAMWSTRELDPTTPDEVIEANNTRVEKYVELMEESGYEVKYNSKIRVSVDPDTIDWKINNLDKVLYMNSFRRRRKKTADS